MFNHPSQAEPYLPTFSEELLLHARLAVAASQVLIRRMPHDRVSDVHHTTLHANAEYSNLIENETREQYIDAHKSAEAGLDHIGSIGTDALSAVALQDLHRALFSPIHTTGLSPGELRNINVRIQRHIPPQWESIPLFLERTNAVYWKKWNNLEHLLIVAAAAHHRLQWVHPFADGNGRCIRLQSQLALRPLGSHFWSLSRALWHQREKYYEMLSVADTHRTSDLDGRGNLSQQCLTTWCKFFIESCHQEITLAASQFE